MTGMRTTATEAQVPGRLGELAPARDLQLVEGPAPRESAEPSIETRVYRSWAELKALLPAWEEILRESPALSIFSTPEWLGSWWQAFGATRRLTTLAFFDDHAVLLGLVPLYEERAEAAGLGRLHGLRLVGDGSMDSDNLDLVFRPGFERVCCRAFLDWLSRSRGWDLCSLNTLPAESVGARTLWQALSARKWPLRRTESPNAAIEFPSDWQSYLDSLTSSFRPLLTRYPRRLSNRFAVRVYRWDDPGRLPEALDLLFALHQKRWLLAHEPGSFGSPERREFYRRMAAAFLERGWLEFWFLELDGRAVATQFCFRYRESVYLLQEGFDPDFAADKVGYALRAATLQYFLETGAKRYDFLGGLNTHKRNWGARPGTYQNLCFAQPLSLGGCHIALDTWRAQGKEWLRRRLPASAWSVLHQVKTTVSGAQRQEILRDE